MIRTIPALSSSTRIAIIGLGYVGLPLAAAFAEKYPVTGFDTNPTRIGNLKLADDHTQEVTAAELKTILVDTQEQIGLYCTDHLADLKACTVFIITVPTPTDKNHRPDLSPLLKATETVASALKPGDLVIYESTVYPGVTEDECVPILEKLSGLKFNTDFYAGYSPERINPGDKEHTITKILKVTSGSTPEIADYTDALYRSIIVAGTYKASSIKVAEAAKVIENAQRDINIAFVNELSKIFNRIGIDTREVLEAAGTKWNFLKFYPGLVGGHCIGVDPYYLAQKAQESGYHPGIILAGRRLNDEMGNYVAQEVIKKMINRDIQIKDANILILGFTFKENCPDVRNTKVIDVIRELESYNTTVSVYDPWARPEEVAREYGVRSCNSPTDLQEQRFDAIILTVGHEEFRNLNLGDFKNENCIVYDVKGFFNKADVDYRL
jgi:UDP-N-acetyl-D-galactosamine dehydrogenase